MELRILSGERSRSSFKVKKIIQSGAEGDIVFPINTFLVCLHIKFYPFETSTDVLYHQGPEPH